ncbi:MAG: valine--tRNA ligase [Alphaproteobacteria bacterium]
MLEQTYNAQAAEKKHTENWEKQNLFAPSGTGEPYCVMMPPPNVTGSLHMGHGLTFTLQDILIRYHRMKGEDTLWQPGTDHAGIATQNLVERMLDKESVSKNDIGRAKFLERVWEWKEESGGMITQALRRLGASPDWERERFTMDEGLSNAVRKVFVSLHRDKLIYKDNRLVNWDPKLKTAISDLEVEQRDVQGHYWYFKYPVEGEENRFITVATTRPETMLGDSGVAVHPDDERYKDLVGKNVILPLTGRKIPIVADEYSDMEKGTGAVKITPAHDFNDYEVGERHGLEKINVMDIEARINNAAPEKYRGLDRYAARKQVVADLEALGLVEKIDATSHAVPYGDRSGVPIEPFLTDQWYVDAEKLAQPAIKAVKEGRTKFVPAQWEKTYFHWMENIQPWCISRQLWWGHRIPAWYAEDGEIFVAMDEAEALAMAEKHYGKKVTLTQDEDVLDTWFSSGLWPFSTLGWGNEEDGGTTPENLALLEKYYSTNVLVTGFDIIFFWVARMMMMGLHFMDDVPFDTVYVHALVRDEHGNKMSKSKGNVIDPTDLIEKYGADALRYALTSLAVPGQDIKLSEHHVETARNFVTKIWNATRYCQMNEAAPDPDFDPTGVQNPVNKWIIGKIETLKLDLEEIVGSYRFDLMSTALHEFIWKTFCDWYLEFTKPMMKSDDAEETKKTIAWVLQQILIVLHPVMPFVTEEIWESFGTTGTPLITTTCESLGDLGNFIAAKNEVNLAIDCISTLRSLRTEMNVPAGEHVEILISHTGPLSPEKNDFYNNQQNIINRMARVSSCEIVEKIPDSGYVQGIMSEGITIGLKLGADVLDAARARYTKEIDKLSIDIKKIAGRLGNKGFVDKAPAAVVEENKKNQAELEAKKAVLVEALARLDA